MATGLALLCFLANWPFWPRFQRKISKEYITLNEAKRTNLHLNKRILKFALVTRRPYCPGRPKKLCFTTPSLTTKVSTARLGVVKQSSFGLPGQYGRRVTRANGGHFGIKCTPHVIHISLASLHCRFQGISTISARRPFALAADADRTAAVR